MRTFFLVILSAATVICASAQDRAGADDTARFAFPETAALRARIAAYDSSRVMLGAAARAADSLLTITDSLRNAERPWDGAPMMRAWHERFPHPTDSMLDAWRAAAMVLHDSASVLHMLDVQRSAVRVDSVIGVVDLVPIEVQRIYRVRCADSSVRYVQFDNPHQLHDTVAVCATPFGRKIFLVPAPGSGWDMLEGALPAVSSDSIFDVYREVVRPRAYELYDQFAARFSALRAQREPAILESMDDLRRSMRRDVEVLSVRIRSLALSAQIDSLALWRENLLLAARDDESRGAFLSAAHRLERLVVSDATYPGATAALARVRTRLDSVAKATVFGADGRKDMALIPGGEVLLRTGERFRPETYFIDHAPVSIQVYELFEAAAPYHSRGKWRDKIIDDDSVSQAVKGLTAEDKLAFAQWAGKRVATPQEIEFAAASGFATLAQRQRHAETPNLYHVTIDLDGFYCVRDVAALSEMERDAVAAEARIRAREVRDKIDSLQ